MVAMMCDSLLIMVIGIKFNFILTNKRSSKCLLCHKDKQTDLYLSLSFSHALKKKKTQATSIINTFQIFDAIPH